MSNNKQFTAGQLKIFVENCQKNTSGIFILEQ